MDWDVARVSAASGEVARVFDGSGKDGLTSVVRGDDGFEYLFGEGGGTTVPIETNCWGGEGLGESTGGNGDPMEFPVGVDGFGEGEDEFALAVIVWGYFPIESGEEGTEFLDTFV